MENPSNPLNLDAEQHCIAEYVAYGLQEAIRDVVSRHCIPNGIDEEKFMRESRVGQWLTAQLDKFFLVGGYDYRVPGDQRCPECGSPPQEHTWDWRRGDRNILRNECRCGRCDTQIA